MDSNTQNRLASVTLSMALILMIGWLLKVGQAILLPVLVAIIAVYVLTSAADALVRVPVIGRLPRRWRRLLVLAGIVALFLMLAGFITSNAAALSTALPRYVENFDTLQAQLLGYLGLHELPSWANIGQNLLDLVDATTLMPAVLAAVSNAGTVIVAASLYAVFIMAELDRLPDKTHKALARYDRAEAALDIARKVNERIGRYLAAKTLVNVILGLVSLGILLALGIEHAVFWAILIGLLNYVPYIGSIIAVIFPVTMSLIQFAAIPHALLTLVALFVPQMVVAYVVEPKFLGKSVNLSPFSVLLSLAVWTALWGMIGAILAVPLTAMVMIVLAEIPATRFLAVMMSESGDL
ncbi:Predicted PurR-regulated permease PerM [Cribrihabitans marinus]|uniref:Predicted PurR-regulated permease PerM n=1 Tax=Cribrihabitans marinus TaxID=1227549 RepID=A0A1H6XZY7_9RHOB|nr:AI-2E family transporter [Cribrihabitans marinus]GGH28133.1 AI-2E family transporter [Cribrihabitans marinus]SEJ33204.1 Predicted PurR-regulated permease PerM [Cribrihabitans marinus]